MAFVTVDGRGLTAAHVRAIRLLDGAWQTKFGKDSAAVRGLVLYHSELAEASFGNHGARGGRMWAFRLTDAGVAFKYGPFKEVA